MYMYTCIMCIIFELENLHYVWCCMLCSSALLYTLENGTIRIHINTCVCGVHVLLSHVHACSYAASFSLLIGGKTITSNKLSFALYCLLSVVISCSICVSEGHVYLCTRKRLCVHVHVYCMYMHLPMKPEQQSSSYLEFKLSSFEE